MTIEERLTQGINQMIAATGMSHRKIASETSINPGQLSNFLRNSGALGNGKIAALFGFFSSYAIQNKGTAKSEEIIRILEELSTENLISGNMLFTPSNRDVCTLFLKLMTEQIDSVASNLYFKAGLIVQSEQNHFIYKDTGNIADLSTRLVQRDLPYTANLALNIVGRESGNLSYAESLGIMVVQSYENSFNVFYDGKVLGMKDSCPYHVIAGLKFEQGEIGILFPKITESQEYSVEKSYILRDNTLRSVCDFFKSVLVADQKVLQELRGL